MAIYPKLVAAAQPHPNTEPSVDVEAWTEQATQALQAVAISGPSVEPARGISASLTIPLDSHSATPQRHVRMVDGEKNEEAEDTLRGPSSSYRRREPLRRDSLKRREALLKGKEGSRQRRRWENDRLLNNPWAQPPLPTDWEVHPTHPRHVVPYYLAPLWDAQEYEKGAEKNRATRKAGLVKEPGTQIPKEVRAKLKRAKAARGLLQDLEEEVRAFAQKWNMQRKEAQDEGLYDVDSEEEEIVFVGRSGQMHDSPARKKMRDELEKEKLVFDGLVDDRGASFGRWLVHSIATYYGLRTWSVTVGDPARREAYIGISEMKSGRGTQPLPGADLPRPLWGLV